MRVEKELSRYLYFWSILFLQDQVRFDLQTIKDISNACMRAWCFTLMEGQETRFALEIVALFIILFNLKNLHFDMVQCEHQQTDRQGKD